MISFSKEEIRDIIISIVIISIIFAYNPWNPINTLDLLPISFITIIVAFLFHELAHRSVARKFGCAAEYRLWLQGLLIGLVFMFFGFKFVAPGAVFIQPYRFGRWGFTRTHLTSKELGLIAVAGPAVNLIFAIIFSLIPGSIFGFLTFINAWLATINLIPVPPLDGSKIFVWKPWLWLLLFLGAILLAWPYLFGTLGI